MSSSCTRQSEIRQTSLSHKMEVEMCFCLFYAWRDFCFMSLLHLMKNKIKSKPLPGPAWKHWHKVGWSVIILLLLIKFYILNTSKWRTKLCNVWNDVMDYKPLIFTILFTIELFLTVYHKTNLPTRWRKVNEWPAVARASVTLWTVILTLDHQIIFNQNVNQLFE